MKIDCGELHEMMVWFSLTNLNGMNTMMLRDDDDDDDMMMM